MGRFVGYFFVVWGKFMFLVLVLVFGGIRKVYDSFVGRSYGIIVKGLRNNREGYCGIGVVRFWIDI